MDKRDMSHDIYILVQTKNNFKFCRTFTAS